MATQTTRSRRRNTRQEPASRDPEGTRRALVESAVRLFGEEGYHATSVQQIVNGASLTKGAFYHHFDSKEDVLYEIHDQFMDYYLDRLRAVVGRDEPPDVLVRRIVSDVLLETMAIYKPEITVFLQERRFLSSQTFSDIQRKRDEFERLVIEVIERGIDCGVFKPAGPPRVLAFAVIGIGAWAHTWLDPKGSLSPRQIGEIFGEIVVDGLTAGTPIQST